VKADIDGFRYLSAQDVTTLLLRARILAGTEQAADAKKEAQKAVAAFRAEVRKTAGQERPWKSDTLVELLAREVVP